MCVCLCVNPLYPELLKERFSFASAKKPKSSLILEHFAKFLSLWSMYRMIYFIIQTGKSEWEHCNRHKPGNFIIGISQDFPVLTRTLGHSIHSQREYWEWDILTVGQISIVQILFLGNKSWGNRKFPSRSFLATEKRVSNHILWTRQFLVCRQVSFRFYPSSSVLVVCTSYTIWALQSWLLVLKRLMSSSNLQINYSTSNSTHVHHSWALFWFNLNSSYILIFKTICYSPYVCLD